MSGLLARAASFVVEPHTPAETPAAAPAGARALVLGPTAEAPPFAAALAGALRARERASAALVCVWGASTADVSVPGASTSGASTSLWSAGGARRLAARLAARDLAVRAAGRLAWLSLPADAEAAIVLGRVLGWLDAPIVTVLAGPRASEHDALMADHDVVVAVRPAVGGALSEAGARSLSALALEGLDGWSLACDPLPAGPARWRARAGLARLAPTHPAVAALGPVRRGA